jgi:hypothetical protein
MGGLMTLPLYGTATLSAGFRPDKARSVVRLRSVNSTAERHAADFALAKTPDEVLRAIEADWPSIFVASDRSIDSRSAGRSNLTLSPRCATKHEPMCSASQLDERTSSLTMIRRIIGSLRTVVSSSGQ